MMNKNEINFQNIKLSYAQVKKKNFEKLYEKNVYISNFR